MEKMWQGRRRPAVWLLGLCATVLVAVGVATTPAQAATSGGWNDWSCRPSAAHPEPVVLLHGLGGQAIDNWLVHAPALASAGYCVYSTTYGTTVFGDLAGGIRSMRDSSKEVGRFVDRVRKSTGAKKVDLVGHSEGTTVAAYYMKFDGGDATVKHFVGFGANYKGTSLSGLGTLAKAAIPFLPNTASFVRKNCPACLEYLPPSDFLDDLNAGGVSVPGPTYTSISSRTDSIVTPYTSGQLHEPGTTDIVLQDVCRFDFSGHLSMAIDPNVTMLIKRALDPEHAGAPRCVPVLLPPL